MQVIKSQYLFKRKQSSSGWQKRWFVLRSTGELLYYKSSKEYEILHIINLHNAHSIHPVYYNKKHPNCLAIVVNEEDSIRLYLLDICTPEDLEIWDSCLRTVVMSLVFAICLDFKQVDLPSVVSLGNTSGTAVSASVTGNNGQLTNTSTTTITATTTPATTPALDLIPPTPRQQHLTGGGIFNLEDLEKSWWEDAFKLVFPSAQQQQMAMAAFHCMQDTPVSTPNVQPQLSNLSNEAHHRLSDIIEHTAEEEEDEQEDEQEDEEEILSPKTESLSSPTTPFSLPAMLNPSSTALTYNGISQQQVAVLSSLLYKRSDGQQNDWDERWFVLRGFNLMWYRDETEYQLANMISLENVLDIVPYFERRKDQKGSGIKKLIGKHQSNSQKLVKIESVLQLMDNYTGKIEALLQGLQESKESASSSAALTVERLGQLKQEVLSEFLLSNGDVLYAMELVMLKKRMVLATNNPDLFEKWMISLYRTYLLIHCG